MTTDELLKKLPSHIGNCEDNGMYVISEPEDDIKWLYLHNDGKYWLASYGIEGEFLCMNPDAEEPPYDNAFALGDTPNEALQGLYDWCVKHNFINNDKKEYKDNSKLMKAKELMIGDWVEVIQNGKQTYTQVQMIDGYKGNSTENECVCDSLYYNIDELKPIEITPEILEKNFDYGRGIGWYDVYFVREDEHDENYFVTKYIAIRDAHRYPKKARFTVIRDNEDNVLFEVKYVHELQHALKLCGIEKEIIL